MRAERAEISPIRQRGLEARLAIDEADVDAAQALRYRVFYEEMSAKPSPEVLASRRDADEFDRICDHLLVIDHEAEAAGSGRVVGTYRLLRRSVAKRHGPFYSASEFDLSCLEIYPGEIMELGRSCVDAEHRNRPTMQLLWSAIAAYVFRYEISLMFGCASLPGTSPDALGTQLSYLYHHHLAPPGVRLRALPDRYVDMRRVPPSELDPKTALAGLPPLIKGYLRLGGFVGEGAVIDHQFNTTDVSIVVKTDLITEKYFKHYEREWRDTTTA
jgi:putative hemolysin